MSDSQNPSPQARRLSPPSIDGSGIVLDSRPPAAPQLIATLAVAVLASLAGASNWWARSDHKSFASFAVPAAISLAVVLVLWLGLLGGRTLDRRRLLRRYPGTLVFSFARTDDAVASMRQLSIIEPESDFQLGSIQVVGDRQGLTFWQGNPPQMNGQLPWTLVRGIQVEMATYPGRFAGGKWQAAIRIDAGSANAPGSILLFNADASALPFSSRQEVAWVERQLHRLFDDSGAPRSTGTDS